MMRLVSFYKLNVLALFLSLVASIAAPLCGQDAAAAAPETTAVTQDGTESPTAPPTVVADKSLDELLTEWSAMDARLKEAESAARADNAPESARSAYIELVDQAYTLIDRIKVSAMAAIASNVGDELAAKTLAGIMLDASHKSDSDKNVLELADQLIAAGVSAELFSSVLTSTRLTPFGKELFDEILIRHKEHQADDSPRVKLTTSQGDIVVELFENEAPNTVANFISLVKAKFYDGLKFHRVIEGFMAQAGCPKGDGSGGPDYFVRCECYEPKFRKHFSGSLSMAHAGRDTGGSQFFITFRATTHLDGRHTVFGRVVSGMDVLDKLIRNYSDAGPIAGVGADTILSAEVVRDRGHEYVPIKISDPAAPKTESGQ